MAYKRSKALAPLIALGVLIMALFGTVAAGSKWGSAHWTPRLALDLAGGTQIVLTPQLDTGQKVTDSNIAEAIKIIRQRVNSTGVSEAEVTKQGASNIVVSLPGDPREQAEAIRLASQSAQMAFRPVLVERAAQEAPAPTPKPSTTPKGTKSSPSSTKKSSATKTKNRVIPQLLLKGATPKPTPTPSATYGIPGKPNPTATANSPSDLNQITDALGKQFLALDCSKPESLIDGKVADPKKPLATCSTDGAAKYILGPVELKGQDIQTVDVAQNTNSQGVPQGDWAVQIGVIPSMVQPYAATTKRLFGQQDPQNKMAVVLDDLVVTALTQSEPIPNGKSQITGNFTNKEAGTLASQIKFGALPMSFKVETQQQISALLGSEQLKSGLIAGLVGLALVAAYSMFQYRGLGLVTIASLLIAGILTYASLLLLSWTQGFRLSLPGVAGTIIAIGVTADSFIVYFERIRDEVRSGRSLVSAVERGWNRARQTIIVSDVINMLAAVVLFFLAVGGVRGFAFTLGLTTVIDLLVVMLFTHPLMQLLARTKFFGGGHLLSGFGAKQLGQPTTYVGRGRVRTPQVADAEPVAEAPESLPAEQRTMTIAERKAAAARAARGAQTGSHQVGTLTADEAHDASRES